MMRAPILDSMLRKLELAADAANTPLEENADYCQMCQIVTDYVCDGTHPTTEQKQFIADTLQAMYKAFGLDYAATLTYYIEKESV